MLGLLLREARVPETPLLIQRARLVFDNNFLPSEFSPDFFHQVFGIRRCVLMKSKLYYELHCSYIYRRFVLYC